MKPRSIFWPLVLIAAGVLWLLIGAGMLPAANLWALTHLLPYILMMLGLGLILCAYWPFASLLVSTLIVVGAVLSVLFAPQLGWAGAPIRGWDIGPQIGGGIAGSGDMKTEVRPLEAFTAVVIRYPGSVTIQQGRTNSVTLTADSNLLPQLKTEVRDGKLYVENKLLDWNQRVQPSKTVQVNISVIDLQDIDFSSAGTLQIENMKGEELNLTVSGAGEVTLAGLDFDRLSCRLSGAGNVSADGKTAVLDLRISGFGSFNGSNLETQTTEVRISGAGQATVWVEEQLDVQITGAGNVEYYGDPQVNQRITGAGNVRKLGAK